MDAKAWLAVPGVVLLLIGAVYGFNEHYISKASAAELFSKAQIDAERGKLETELLLAQHELEYLDSLVVNEDAVVKVERRKRYLESRIHMLEERLITLEDD